MLRKRPFGMTDANWLAAATAHDLERVVPFWADNATILPPERPQSPARKRSASTFPRRLRRRDFRSPGRLKRLRYPVGRLGLLHGNWPDFPDRSRWKVCDRGKQGSGCLEKAAGWLLEMHPGRDQSRRAVKHKIGAQFTRKTPLCISPARLRSAKTNFPRYPARVPIRAAFPRAWLPSFLHLCQPKRKSLARIESPFAK